jgi:hypothetical protein
MLPAALVCPSLFIWQEVSVSALCHIRADVMYCLPSFMIHVLTVIRSYTRRGSIPVS